MISGFEFVVLLMAGAVAGLIGSAGGITSLVSYPALLAVGVGPLTANVANNVALVACWPGSALASRSELRGRASWLRSWVPVAALGAVVGAALLIVTPAGVFARAVPVLVAVGSLALLAEPQLRVRYRRLEGKAHKLALWMGVATLSVYNGYFGAGAGVMILTLLLVLVDHHLPSANALKNMLVGGASVVSATIFTLHGSVDWSAASPLAIGMLAGSRAGPLLARRLPPDLLRRLIAIFGLGLAVYLSVHPGA